MKRSPIEQLSNELLKLILDHIEPEPDKTVPIDRRQFLSVESFHRPPPSARGSLQDVGNFRRASKRFAAVGEPLLFTRVAGRFSQRGLEKLEVLASWPHLTRHVKKFSYLVPYFYSDDTGDEQYSLPGLESASIELDRESLRRKAREQREIRESGRDVVVLKKVIASFTSLQLVQLLRVTDREDEKLLSYIRQHGEVLDPVHLDWAPACIHGSRTIGAALLAADVPWSRFSSPMLSPQSAEFLATSAPQQLPTLAARLTCLALHFDDGNDLDQKMLDLSELFRTVFTTAKAMQAIHVGFPAHRPLNLPLERVFHNVKWEKLVAFGVQGWNLHGQEILDLVLRHREKLKGLRLRDVHLKEDSMWKDVLGTLRNSMQKLEWVSLRRIDYVRHFEDSLMGVEVPDDPPPTQSDSDSEEDEEDQGPEVGRQTSFNGTLDDNDDDTDDTAIHSDSGEGDDTHEMDFPPLDSPILAPTTPWCICNGSRPFVSIEDLGDDGYAITNAKRKLWERWVVRRCPEHD